MKALHLKLLPPLKKERATASGHSAVEEAPSTPVRESLRVFGLDEGDASTMESALARDTSKEKVQKTKKGKKGATLKKPAARGTSQAKSPQKVERKQAHSTFRHRMTSSAYTTRQEFWPSSRA